MCGRLLIALLILVVVAGALTTSVAGAAVNVGTFVDSRFGTGAYLSVSKARHSSRRNDHVVVSYDARSDRYTVRNSAGVVTTGYGCMKLDQDTATCADPALPGEVKIHVEVSGRRSSIRLDSTTTYKRSLLLANLIGTGTAIGGPDSDRMLGGYGRGDDRLIGRMGDDILNGGSGDDTLQGGIGDDRLTSGPGADTLRGGRGGDRLRANDGEADERIACGPGDDVVHLDKLDPKPRRNCEKVRRAPPLGEKG